MMRERLVLSAAPLEQQPRPQQQQPPQHPLGVAHTTKVPDALRAVVSSAGPTPPAWRAGAGTTPATATTATTTAVTATPSAIATGALHANNHNHNHNHFQQPGNSSGIHNNNHSNNSHTTKLAATKRPSPCSSLNSSLSSLSWLLSFRCDSGLKRGLLSPREDAAAAKNKRAQAELENAPDWKHDAAAKPPFSFPALAYIALANGKKTKMLSISDIENFVAREFAFYRLAKDHAWKELLRSSLMQTDAFVKAKATPEERRTVGRKGLLWTVNPEKASQFRADLRRFRTTRRLSRKAAQLRAEQAKLSKKQQKQHHVQNQHHQQQQQIDLTVTSALGQEPAGLFDFHQDSWLSQSANADCLLLGQGLKNQPDTHYWDEILSTTTSEENDEDQDVDDGSDASSLFGDMDVDLDDNGHGHDDGSHVMVDAPGSGHGLNPHLLHLNPSRFGTLNLLSPGSSFSALADLTPQPGPNGAVTNMPPLLASFNRSLVPMPLWCSTNGVVISPPNSARELDMEPDLDAPIPADWN